MSFTKRKVLGGRDHPGSTFQSRQRGRSNDCFARIRWFAGNLIMDDKSDGIWPFDNSVKLKLNQIYCSDCLTTVWKRFSKTFSLVPQRSTTSRRITCKHERMVMLTIRSYSRSSWWLWLLPMMTMIMNMMMTMIITRSQLNKCMAEFMNGKLKFEEMSKNQRIACTKVSS